MDATNSAGIDTIAPTTTAAVADSKDVNVAGENDDDEEEPHHRNSADDRDGEDCCYDAHYATLVAPPPYHLAAAQHPSPQHLQDHLHHHQAYTTPPTSTPHDDVHLSTPPPLLAANEQIDHHNHRVDNVGDIYYEPVPPPPGHDDRAHRTTFRILSPSGLCLESSRGCDFLSVEAATAAAIANSFLGISGTSSARDVVVLDRELLSCAADYGVVIADATVDGTASPALRNDSEGGRQAVDGGGECCWTDGAVATLSAVGAAEEDMMLGAAAAAAAVALPLDLDPLPALFPFSPGTCGGYGSGAMGGVAHSSGHVYKSESHTYHNCRDTVSPTSPTAYKYQYAPKQQVAAPDGATDVLLSLKHAVMHPADRYYEPTTGALYYTAGPLSPNTINTSGICTPTTSSNAGYNTSGPSSSVFDTGLLNNTFSADPTMTVCGGGGGSAAMASGVAPPQMFPSMSVNVSMNMTMHGYHSSGYAGPTTEINYPQVQWTTTPHCQTNNHHHHLPSHPHHHPSLLSPHYGGATYSFTADFRPAATLGIASELSPPHSTMGQQGLGGSPLHQHHHHGSAASGASAYEPGCAKNSAGATTCAAANSRLGSTSNRGESGRRPCAAHSPTMQTYMDDDDMLKPNVCRICGKSYARPSTLKTHLRTHSGEKPYRCADCHKSFSQAANLTAHVRTHSGEKPFRCPVCDRRFSQSSSVTTHMRTHSGERPYRCRLCRKAFSDSSTLTKHLRIHSGEKPYECKLCLLRFSQSGNLNRHMRVHAAGANGQAVSGTTPGGGLIAPNN